MAVSGQATLQSGAIKLIFDLRTRLPGERVEGAVELDMGKASKDGVMSVRLKIRGVAATYVFVCASKFHLFMILNVASIS
jgi:hypothetical protein